MTSVGIAQSLNASQLLAPLPATGLIANKAPQSTGLIVLAAFSQARAHVWQPTIILDGASMKVNVLACRTRVPYSVRANVPPRILPPPTTLLGARFFFVVWWDVGDMKSYRLSFIASFALYLSLGDSKILEFCSLGRLLASLPSSSIVFIVSISSAQPLSS